MTSLATWHLDDLLGRRTSCDELACEGSIRVAAATLSHAPSGTITTTTVVGVLGRDDLSAFRQLVTDVAAEYGLHASTTINVGSFAVRFGRRQVARDTSAGRNGTVTPSNLQSDSPERYRLRWWPWNRRTGRAEPGGEECRI